MEQLDHSSSLPETEAEMLSELSRTSQETYCQVGTGTQVSCFPALRELHLFKGRFTLMSPWNSSIWFNGWGLSLALSVPGEERHLGGSLCTQTGLMRQSGFTQQ